MVPLDRVLNALLSTIVLVGAFIWSYTYWGSVYQPPIKYLSIAVLNKDMKPGEILHGRVTFDRRRNCPATSVRSITQVTPDGDETLIYRDPYPVQHVPTKIGESISLRFDMELPMIEKGNYQFGGVVRADCDGHIFTLELPMAGFNIVE